jgi:hypothetical protein
MNFDFSKIGAFIFALLIVFLIYRRFRRSFGQQPVRPIRMQVRIAMLVIVAGLLLPAALRSSAFLLALLIGITAGIALAVWGGSQTRFLRISKQLYYVPHTYTGIAVSLLFLGRLIYRLIQVYTSAHDPHGAAAAASANPTMMPSSMLSSPLTLGLFFVLMGYYVCYYSIVLWKSKRVVAQEADLNESLPPAHP